MKKLGDVLSVFFDENTLEKAREYGSLFSSWGSMTVKCGIPQAAAHSRITGMEKSLLLVEADHPGWVQILQTKQKELLEKVQKQFPGFFITGIVLRLSRSIPETTDVVSGEQVKRDLTKDSPKKNETGGEPTPADGLTHIGDERLRTALEKLKKSIAKEP
jgi:hypothetical protein